MAEVCILLATYNGERFLAQQLDSLLAQDYPYWHLIAADDRSTDATPQILADFAARLDSTRVKLRHGPGRGVVANFLTLACTAPEHYEAYAFCDQDDVWEPDKLGRAMSWLAQVPADTPALYCSRSLLIDAAGRRLRFSPLPARPPGFAHALVQNIASGNTMVFNAAARRLLVEAGADVAVPVHDWWLYLAVTACGGVVYFDPAATVRYRQHPGNTIGSGAGAWARMRRFIHFLRGQHAAWSQAHCNALARLLPRMPSAQRASFEAFITARTTRGLRRRLAAFKRAGLYRQGAWGQASLWLGVLLGRL